MEAVHYLNEAHIFHFLIQVLVLLVVSHALGALFARFGYPTLAGEILTGIVLGPTLFGRALPEMQAALFPMDLVQQNMLETISWFGVLFLLLVTGFEISLRSAVRQSGPALSIGIIGVAVPLAMGVATFWWFPAEFRGAQGSRVVFTLFLAVAAAISALAIIARVLHDLKILKSDLGVTILSAYVVNDLLGWVVFSFVLGLSQAGGAGHGGGGMASTLTTFTSILVFGALCLTIGSRIVGWLWRLVSRPYLPPSATMLTLVTSVGLFSGAVTQWLGVHAILGFFLAGVMVGNAPEISERSRDVISQMVHAIFVPIFFASIGLKVDFVASFSWGVVLVFTFVALVGKFVGAYVGARVARLSSAESVAMGLAFIPGGAMEIILGILALELEIIGQEIFVAIVFGALSSSIVVGPLLSWAVARAYPKARGGQFLLSGGTCLELSAESPEGAIAELVELACKARPDLDVAQIKKIVLEREAVMNTSLERGVAVPHGRLQGLGSPLIALGRSRRGIEWNARDGVPTQWVFLILSPEEDAAIQVQILGAISRAMSDEPRRQRLVEMESPQEASQLLQDALNSANTPA